MDETSQTILTGPHDLNGQTAENSELDDGGIPASISRRIDPEAVLPAHLQMCSIEQDIWRRLRNHPVPSPDITKEAMRKDARTSDFFNRVLLAVSDRETEILLHNQTRVFKEILGRTLESIWRFMGESWAPRTWSVRSEQPKPDPVRAGTPAPDPGVVAPSGVGSGGGPPPPTTASAASGTNAPPPRRTPRPRGYLGKTFLAWLLTPKYLLLVLTAVFILTSSYFKMQVENMKSAIESYKEAAGAAQELREQLGQAIASAKSEKDRLTDQIGALTLESATLRNGVHERDARLEGLRAQLVAADSRVKDLREQLKKHEEKQADDVKAIQSQRDAMQGERDQAKQEVARLEAQARGLADAKDANKKMSEERAAIIRDLTNQITMLQTTNENLLNKNAELEQSRTLLKFARTYVHNTRNEIRSFWGIDKSNLEKYLNEYEAAEKTVTEVNN